MTQAGPSRRRRSSASPSHSEGSVVDDTQQRRQSRQSFATREDLFRKTDPKEKLRIGNGYRELQKKADQVHLEATADSVQLRQMIAEGNRLFKDVKDTDLAAMDAKFLATTTEAAANLIRKAKLSQSTFDVDGFLSSVKVKLGLDRLDRDDDDDDELEDDDVLREEAALRRRARGGVIGDWAEIGWMAAQLYRRVPGVEFMYGPLAVEHKKRSTQRRERQKDVAPEVRPSEIVADAQTKSKDITTSNVRTIFNVLRKLDPSGKGINYFTLVVNPHDFGQTVENVFYASFLIRDGRAGISVLDDGEVMIHYRERPSDDLGGEYPNHQAVIELTQADWKEAITLFNITTSAIPNRGTASQMPNASGWYAGTATQA